MQGTSSRRPGVVLDVPPLADLLPLADVARMLGMSLQSAHRWRLHPVTPLAAWRRGHAWCSTVEAAEDFVRRRTLAGTSDDLADLPPPGHSAKRRKQIADAVRECERLGC